MHIIIDAVACHEVKLNIPPVGSIKKSSPSYLLIGHTANLNTEVDGFIHFNRFHLLNYYSCYNNII